MAGSITIPIVYTEEALMVQPDDFNEMVLFFKKHVEALEANNKALEVRIAVLEALHP